MAALWWERWQPCNAAVAPLKARLSRKGRQLQFVRPTGFVLCMEVIERFSDLHRIHHHLWPLLGLRQGAGTGESMRPSITTLAT